MIRVSTILGVFLLFILLLPSLSAEPTSEDWELASQNMVKALASNNDGLKVSVLHNIIKYSDNLEIEDAVFDVMRIYRSHENEGVRQLALVALHKMDNNWAMNFLKRAVHFEQSPVLKKRIYAILYDYYQTDTELKSLFAKTE